MKFMNIEQRKKRIIARGEHSGHCHVITGDVEFDEQGEKVILLEVICPSTNRVYHLYPPNQNAKTCFEAKASTFGNKAIVYRHGDVGLFKVGSDGKMILPFSET
jgi:hypothetical protein